MLMRVRAAECERLLWPCGLPAHSVLNAGSKSNNKPRMDLIGGGPSGSSAPACDGEGGKANSLPGTSKGLPYVCEVPGCGVSFSTSRGRSVHYSRKHKDWWDERAPVQHKKAPWSDEETGLLARQEANLVSEGVRNVNMALRKVFPNRSLESIKSKRKPADYKARVLELVKEMADAVDTSSSSADSESNDPSEIDDGGDALSDAHAATSMHEDLSSESENEVPVGEPDAMIDLSSKLIEFVKGLPTSTDSKFNAEWLDRICRTIDHASRSDIMEDLTLYLLNTFEPKTRKRPSLDQVDNPPPMSRRQARRADYAKIQDLWKRNPCQCLKRLLKGVGECNPLPMNIMVPFWETIMSRPEDASPGVIPPAMIIYDLWVPITVSDIRSACPASNTAAGPDGLTARMLRKVPVNILVKILNLFMLCEKIPIHLLESRTVLIPKIPDPTSPSEYRPLTISSVMIRLFHKILATRMRKLVEIDVRQKAFREVDGCAENTFLLDLALRYHRKKNKPLYIASIDVAKAFDSVTHNALMDTLITKGVPDEMVRYIRYVYTNSRTKLTSRTWTSVGIRPTCGVKQGDPLSPIVFNCVIDRLIKQLPREVGIQVGNLKLNAIAFADDIIFMASSPIGLQTTINNAVSFLKKCGLAVNAAKCYTIALKNVPHMKRTAVSMTDQFLCDGIKMRACKRTDEWTYLGIPFTAEGRAYVKSVEKLKNEIEILGKAPLKPQQRLFGVRTIVLTGHYHQLVLGNTNLSILKKYDLVIRAAVRKWCNLPKDVPNAYTADVRDGGLGIPSMRWLIPLMRLRRLENLLSDEDGFAADDLLKEKEKVSKRLKDKGVGLTTGRMMRDRWARLLHHAVDGIGLKDSNKVPRQHEWISEGSRFLSGKDFVSFCRLRINALPVRSRTTRGRRMERMCRGGCYNAETLNHVLQQCHRTHDIRIQRHNAVTTYLVRKLRQQEYEVVEEPHFQTVNGLRKPDVIAHRGKTAILLDSQIVGEQADLGRAHRTKIAYYEPLAADIMHRFNVEDVIYTTATLSCRGIWSSDSWRRLQQLGILRTREQKVISTRVLLGGVIAFRTFNARTTAWSKRRGR